MTEAKRVSISDIEGGQAPTPILPDHNITIEDLWKTYRWYPGFAEMHDLAVKAIWCNGLTDDSIPEDRILELKDGHLFAYLDGYVAYVLNTYTDPPSVEAWHPQMEGVGFRITGVSPAGYPTKISIVQRLQETDAPMEYDVPNFPVKKVQIQLGMDGNGNPINRELHVRSEPIIEKNSYGFFLVRNRRGLKGLRGLPEFMPLMHPIRAQNDILMAYVPFAVKQGMDYPTVYLENNTKQNRRDVKAQFSNQPQTNKIVILGINDYSEWVSPQAGAYDPFPILNWVDMLMARKTQMNKLMLEGDPAGYLSASETAINNWEKEVKDNQVFWASQFMPIWKVLGAADETTFQEPTRPTFTSLMEGAKNCVDALLPIVEPKDIVDLLNEYFQKSNKKWKLTPLSEEKMLARQGGGEGNGNTKPSNQDKGNKSDK